LNQLKICHLEQVRVKSECSFIGGMLFKRFNLKKYTNPEPKITIINRAAMALIFRAIQHNPTMGNRLNRIIVLRMSCLEE